MDTGTLPEEFSFVSKDSRLELTLKKNGDMIKVRNLSIEPIHFRTSERFKVELGGMSSSFEVADLEVSSNSREEREALVREKLDVNPELDEEVRTELRECFVQNNDVLWLFEDDVGRVTDVVHKIETGNAKPLRKHYMPTNQPLRMAINKELKKMERMKLIRKIIGSPWCSPVLGVWKDDARTKVRIVNDFRDLNSVTIQEPYRVLLIDDLLRNIVKHRMFTSGLVGATHTFTLVADKVLPEEMRSYVINYIDDFLIQASTPEDMVQNLNKFFEQLRKFHLKISLEKTKDNGSAFEEYLEGEKILHLTTSAYNPCANELVEYMNKFICRTLAIFEHSNEQEWDKLLPSIVSAINSSRNSATGMSPYFCVYGKEMRTGLENQLELEDVQELAKHDFVQNKNRLEMVRNIAKMRRDKSRLDSTLGKYLTTRHVDFDVGQEVLVRNKSSKTGYCSTWLPVYNGPYQIVRKLGNTSYEVLTEHGTVSRHVSDLILFHSAPEEKKSDEEETVATDQSRRSLNSENLEENQGSTVERDEQWEPIRQRPGNLRQRITKPARFKDNFEDEFNFST
ncbi:hypothetical protein HDE_04267 [Halotydeus destructor]|nr:hypothetical protein HDE_04267 [Halotydeus destructor]